MCASTAEASKQGTPEEALEDLKESKEIIDFIKIRNRPTYQLYAAIFCNKQKRSWTLLEFNPFFQRIGKIGRHPIIKIDKGSLDNLERTISETLKSEKNTQSLDPR